MPRILLFILILCFTSLGFGKPTQETPFLEQTDARGETLEQFITKCMSRHFTMKGGEASFVLDYGSGNPIPPVFEMKNFTMKPVIQALTPADQLNGIDLKFSLSIRSDVYREGKIGTHRYGDWKDGTPPPANGFISGFQFQRRNGLFEFQPSFGAKNCVSRGHYQSKKRN